eukprot:362936-Chlamydomonas_euryale.AAC.6
MKQLRCGISIEPGHKELRGSRVLQGGAGVRVAARQLGWGTEGLVGEEGWGWCRLPTPAPTSVTPPHHITYPLPAAPIPCPCPYPAEARFKPPEKCQATVIWRPGGKSINIPPVADQVVCLFPSADRLSTRICPALGDLSIK